MKYYTYIYWREDKSPRYVGKGCGDRYNHPNHNVEVPPDNLITFVVENTTEEWAFFMEMEMIDKWGRLDDGTGILENRTDGGDNPPRGTPESYKKASRSLRLYNENNPHLVAERGKKISKTKKAKAHITSEQVRQRHAAGNFYTEEGKQRVREAARRGGEHHRKGVLCVETGITYKSIREAAREMKYRRRSITESIQQNRRVGRYTFVVIE